jgi:plasmid stabilization system protein ParE
MILISARARREIAEAAQWWLENRDKAPEAFEEDLAEAFDLILHAPHLGILVPSRIKFVRRVLLRRVRYYLYYRDTAPGVEVLALWHASRLPPKL